jgi:hypothetical protein
LAREPITLGDGSGITAPFQLLVHKTSAKPSLNLIEVVVMGKLDDLALAQSEDDLSAGSCEAIFMKSRSNDPTFTESHLWVSNSFAAITLPS